MSDVARGFWCGVRKAGRVGLVAMVLSVALSGLLQAQRVAQPGERIRLDAPRWYPGYVGEFLGVDHDSLHVQGKRLILSVPLNAVNGIEVSTSTHSRVGEYGAKGVAVGAAGGFVLGTLTCGFLGDSGNADCRSELVVLSGVAGLVTGLLLGSQHPSDTWVDATLPAQMARSGSSNAWAKFLARPVPIAVPVSISF